MRTKASTTKKRSRAKATAKKEGSRKKSSALQIQNLPLGKIKPDPEQSRKTFNKDVLQQLSKSMEAHGVLQPISVRQLNDHYVIVMDERRYRANYS
ncbi:Chromosome (plasmid) partitioning protein ParB [Croceitalea dokdonensis DOKDO 023]|uniref:Chromosome (Plasmid) partitioning protein ParB n=1 Tax=Croceitalea dokdonensis DOKDO 023 TaxID=1300341 RepID=A0A0P7ATK3_9FLAO|nr:ParB N-terminal domain-containing protein [Croceitalea dokdonensis]KPM31215.1 Chromosome (plasmid) partitioning protein ParB [Croceitalea dokdonensis DOKDO 023]